MRAWIDGIKVEGTPAEVAKFNELLHQEVNRNNYSNMPVSNSLYNRSKLGPRDIWHLDYDKRKNNENRRFYSYKHDD